MAARLGLVFTGAALCQSVIERCVDQTNCEGAQCCSFTIPGLSSSSLRYRASRRAPKLQSRSGRKRLMLVRMSVDVDDSAAAEGSLSTEELIKEATEDLQKTLNPRKDLEERYLVVNSGKHECRSCGYVYESEKGDPEYPIPGGIAFSELPVDWRCPTCGAARSFFQSKGEEIAGFVQNQSYGLGGNSLTEGQKSLLIYGSLVFFFVLFLAGYLLQ